MSKTSEMIRQMFTEADDKRDAGLTTPEDVVRYDDISYGTDHKWQMLDVYRPKDRGDEILPVIVSVHGGGWVYGDKERYQYYCMSLAQRGFAVVNFTYRLAPEHKYPAQIEDTNLVFHWIFSHASEYGLDLEHIFAVGDSAGANNLGLYAAICTNPTYAQNYDFSVPEGFVPKAIALNCGVYEIDFRKQEGNSTPDLMDELLPEDKKEELLALLGVAEYVTEDYPPTFIMTAVDDFLKMQALVLAKKFTECNVPFAYRFYGDKNNKLAHVFHCNMRLQDAADCNDDECKYFEHFCK